jgi:hypothetical protein
MLIELDLLFAVSALLLILPASMLLISNNQSTFLSYSEAFGNVLVSDAGMQRLAFQIGSSGQPEGIMSLANASGYSISRYNLSASYESINASLSRLVVANGIMYRLSVEK